MTRQGAICDSYHIVFAKSVRIAYNIIMSLSIIIYMLLKTSAIDRIPDGWIPIIQELESKLIEICPDYKAEQIKEKFASLRYYYSLPEDADNPEIRMAFDAHILDAYNKTVKTCQYCGEPGSQVSVRYRVAVLCDNCNNNT